MPGLKLTFMNSLLLSVTLVIGCVEQREESKPLNESLSLT